MYVTHQVQLQPSKRQEQYFKQACGVSRQAYNIMLQRSRDAYECWQYGEIEEKPSVHEYSLRKEFNKLKKLLLPWTKQVTKYAADSAITNLAFGYGSFFRGAGFPRFKRRKHGTGSYTMCGGPKTDYAFSGRKLKVPGSRKLGLVRTTQSPRYEGVIKKVTIKQRAGKWYATICYEVSSETPLIPTKTKLGTVGVDLGIKDLAVLSDGTVFDNPRAYVRAQRKLRKEDKALSRKVRGSSNWEKQLLKLQRAHKKVSDVRKGYLHNLTSHLSKNYQKVVIEDLNVRGMTKNRKLSKHILDAGFCEIRRQLEYKCEWYGSELVVVDRWFPSSKLCSQCGAKKEKLTLNERVYNCASCGESLDRDLNAALNLAGYDSCPTACGDGVRLDPSSKGLALSEKQESSEVGD